MNDFIVKNKNSFDGLQEVIKLTSFKFYYMQVRLLLLAFLFLQLCVHVKGVTVGFAQAYEATDEATNDYSASNKQNSMLISSLFKGVGYSFYDLTNATQFATTNTNIHGTLTFQPIDPTTGVVKASVTYDGYIAGYKSSDGAYLFYTTSTYSSNASGQSLGGSYHLAFTLVLPQTTYESNVAAKAISPGSEGFAGDMNNGRIALNSALTTQATAPIITTTQGTTIETAGTPVVVDTGVLVSANSSLITGQVVVTGNYHSNEDRLLFATNSAMYGNISATFNTGNGMLSMSSAGGTATISQWTSAMRAVNFNDIISNTTNIGNRTISFLVIDNGTLISNSALKTIDVTTQALIAQSTVTVSPTSASVSTSGGGSYTFTASGGNGTGLYVWGGAGTGLTGPSVTIQFAQNGTFPVTVTNATNPPAPVISYISPNTGSALGATNVQIAGTSFTSANSVTFGGVAASSYTVSSDTLINAVAPAHAAGVVDIIVKTPYPGDTSTTSVNTKYTYLAMPIVTWATPSSITYGTALSGTQLNATSTTAGGYVYSPASGVVLPAGNQTINVAFNPTDTANYTSNSSVYVVLTVKRHRRYQ